MYQGVADATSKSISMTLLKRCWILLAILSLAFASLPLQAYCEAQTGCCCASVCECDDCGLSCGFPSSPVPSHNTLPQAVELASLVGGPTSDLASKPLALHFLPSLDAPERIYTVAAFPPGSLALTNLPPPSLTCR